MALSARLSSCKTLLVSRAADLHAVVTESGNSLRDVSLIFRLGVGCLINDDAPGLAGKSHTPLVHQERKACEHRVRAVRNLSMCLIYGGFLPYPPM
jgi:hypothetical protein